MDSNITMDILIPIEISSRELLYKTYISCLLAKEGYNCYFGTKKNIAFLIDKFENYIYLDKGYHKDVSDGIYKKIKSKNGIIINLDEEGAIDFPDGSTLKSRYSKKLFDESSKVLLWGEYQFDLLKKLNLPINKINITGHPRFELLKEKYHSLYNPEVEAINKKHKKFILINTNFGFGNNIKGDDFVRKNYGGRIKRIEEIIAFDKVKQEAYVNLVKRLSIESNDLIVYRPHPEENIDFYIKEFEGFKNVQVIFEGSVVPWLLASKVMIHPDCTTGIEAIMLGKKSISFLPKKTNKEIVTSLPISISYNFNDLDKLIKFIDQAKFKINEDYENDLNIINNYFSYSKNSCQEIINCFNEVKNEPLKKNNSIKLKDKLLLNSKDFKLKIDKSVKTKLSKKKLNGFDYRTLSGMKKELENINNEIKEVKIEKISHYLFKISKV